MCSCFKSNSKTFVMSFSSSAPETIQRDEVVPVKKLTQDAMDAFQKRFGYEAVVAAKAPGRVNLIGEHTDYNDGFVLPMALPMVTVVVGSPTESGTCRVQTMSSVIKNKYTEFSIHDLSKGEPRWANYVKGVAAQMKGRLPSFDAVINTSVPMGGGVSSSASLEVATLKFLEQFEERTSEVPDIEKVLMCQKAEHEFAGVPCGIMDQYISLLASVGHALLIDCRSQKCELIRMRDPDLVVLVINSHIKHELSGSEYPMRKQQCQDGAKIIGVVSLREATEDMLEENKAAMDEETYRRVRHVITEIKRTRDAATALQKEDYKTFGQLMVDSHKSLRDDYEVSCIELDQLVEYAMEMKDKGVYGSRMTGGGFGGCTVTLVTSSTVEEVIRHINKKYSDNGKKASFFVCPPSEGARSLAIPLD